MQFPLLSRTMYIQFLLLILMLLGVWFLFCLFFVFGMFSFLRLHLSVYNFNSLNDVKKLEWICHCENHNILKHLGVFLRKHCRKIFIFFIYLCLSIFFFLFLDVLLLCLRHEVECHSYICWTSPEALSLGVCG